MLLRALLRMNKTGRCWRGGSVLFCVLLALRASAERSTFSWFAQLCQLRPAGYVDLLCLLSQTTSDKHHIHQMPYKLLAGLQRTCWFLLVATQRCCCGLTGLLWDATVWLWMLRCRQTPRPAARPQVTTSGEFPVHYLVARCVPRACAATPDLTRACVTRLGYRWRSSRQRQPPR